MKAAGFMIFGRRTVIVHGKLLEEGLARKQKWGSFVFLFLGREISGSVSLELRSGGYRETNQSRKRRWEERIFLEVYMCVVRNVR
jgi:hypothetical protein